MRHRCPYTKSCYKVRLPFGKTAFCVTCVPLATRTHKCKEYCFLITHLTTFSLTKNPLQECSEVPVSLHTMEKQEKS